MALSQASRSRSADTNRARLVAEIRAIIQKEGLRSGDCLPPEDVLAKRLSVSRMTLRAATGQLVRQNVLERRQGAGTFIRGAVKTQIGLLIGARSFGEPTSMFWHWVVRSMRTRAGERNCQLQLYFVDDSGHLDDAAYQAVRDRQMNGAILISTPIEADDLRRGIMAQFERANVPVVGFLKTEPESLHRVNLDFAPLFREAIQRLARAGHRTLGFAARVDQALWMPPMLLRAAEEHGMRVEPSWVLDPPRESPNGIAHGRMLFEAYQALPERPAALLFTDHYLTQGFMYAQLARTGRVPDGPALAVLEAKNTVLELPWPVVRIQFDARPVVDRTIQVLCDLIRHKPVPEHEVRLAPAIEPAS
jgi:DNA-binding LacI/PurR family transcriptional regulator